MRKQTGKVRLGGALLPDDILKDGIEWQDSPEIARAERDLARRWEIYLRVTAELDAEWKVEAVARLAAVTTEIECDALLTELDAELAADRASNDAEVDRYLARLAEIQKARRDAWQHQARQQLDAATADMNASINRTDRQKLLAAGLIRGRKSVTA